MKNKFLEGTPKIATVIVIFLSEKICQNLKFNFFSKTLIGYNSVKLQNIEE